MNYETVIGLEIHAQLRTRTKIFCGCRSVFGDEPNTHACPVCMGLPGALPVLNRQVVENAIMMGLAIGCRIAAKSVFARKNYFYPDLPKGYQISQYDMPLCENGRVSVTVDGEEKKIGITRIHLEEDAGKLVHDQDIDSLFDVNRCGTPLIEIVTDPDIRSPGEAYAFLTELRRVLEYLDICDCNMEEGSLRCDANISIRPQGHTALGTKTELKNLNSFRGVEKALAYEAKRQRRVLESGGSIEQQTYLWNPDTGKSRPMRSKEDAHDYRYFPEPDLMPLVVNEEWISSCRDRLPELPQKRRKRFLRRYGLTVYMADTLTESKDVAEYFEKTVAVCSDARLVANWVMGEILRMTKENSDGVAGLRTTPARLGSLLNEVCTSAISASAAKTVLEAVEKQNRDPREIIEEKGLTQVSDASILEQAVDSILAAHPREYERLKRGERKLTGFFMGQIMRSLKGSGNPGEINRILNDRAGQ